MKKIYYGLVSIILFIIITYFCIGFYIAHNILRIDHTCGEQEGSLPNTWSTDVDYPDIQDEKRISLRKNFKFNKYHLNEWESVSFTSREPNILISGWLFNYHINSPIVIIVHGIFPNGKCKSEPNIIASLLIKNGINALTIDLRNYGQSTLVTNYENLGLTEYLDVLGAFDFLQTRGFKKNKIGLVGISLGAGTVIFAASHEPAIKAIWAESSLAIFDMILSEEISRYGFPNIFGPVVSLFGQFLSGVDPSELNPAYALKKYQNYYFTHGENDKRVYASHFSFLKNYATNNNISAEYWLVPNAGHVDAVLMFPEEYGQKMYNFFKKNLGN